MSCAYNSGGGHSVLGAVTGVTILYTADVGVVWVWYGCGLSHHSVYYKNSSSHSAKVTGSPAQSGGHAHSHRQLLDGPRSVIPVTALSTVHCGVTAPCNCRQTSALNVPSVINSIILKDKAPLGILLALEVGSICICR